MALVESVDDLRCPSADFVRSRTVRLGFKRSHTASCRLCVFLPVTDRRLEGRKRAFAQLLLDFVAKGGVQDQAIDQKPGQEVRLDGRAFVDDFLHVLGGPDVERRRLHGMMTKSLATMAERSILLTRGGPSMMTHS